MEPEVNAQPENGKKLEILLFTVLPLILIAVSFAFVLLGVGEKHTEAPHTFATYLLAAGCGLLVFDKLKSFKFGNVEVVREDMVKLDAKVVEYRKAVDHLDQALAKYQQLVESEITKTDQLPVAATSGVAVIKASAMTRSAPEFEPRDTVEEVASVEADITPAPAPTSAPSSAWPDIPAANGRFEGTAEDDPRKGMFGGQARRDGWSITAEVQPAKSVGYYLVDIKVTYTRDPERVKGQPVTFYIHDSFPSAVRQALIQDGTALLSLLSYGAFTVGALAGTARVPLELDMSLIPGVPEEFAEN